jgi:glycosyltransferase involved in cell wall biosynthesis
MIKYSIVIPNYNSSKWLKRCLDSVLEQTYKNFELIIVDDMSTDDSPNIIKEYNDERIKSYRLMRKGYNGGTRNFGVSVATGDYILFLDCDDWLVDKNVLKEINNTILQNPNVDLVRLSYVAHKGRDARVKIRDNNLKDLANSVFCAPWTKMVKREKFVPFPENTLLEDVVQHIAQIDNIDTMVNHYNYWAVWNRENEDAISSDVAKYTEESKRFSSVYRNYADLLDLKCKHDYCEEQRQFRLRNYKDIILKDDVLNLINGGSSQ